MSQISSSYVLSPTIATTFATDAGNATSALNTITIAGGTNIGTTGAGSTVTVNLDDKIILPATNAADTQGSISIGSCKWHAYGVGNIFIGDSAGNLTLTGISNLGIGVASCGDLTTGFNNVGISFGSLGTLTTGDHNCAIGYSSGADFTTGSKNSLYGAFSGATLKTSSSYNTALGAWALMDLTLTDRILNYNISIGYLSGTGITADNANSNILIASDGANESNTLRIGRQGNGNNQINKAYIAGIYGVTPGGTINLATIDSNGQLGSTLTPTVTTIYSTTFDTNVTAAKLTISGTTITATGTDAIVSIHQNTKGGGGLIFKGIDTGFTGSEWATFQDSLQTVDATQTDLIILPIDEGQMITIKAYINGFRSTFTDALGAEVLITAYRPTGGNVTQIGEEIINVNSTSTSDVFADVDVGAQTVNISVKGVAAQTWNWATTFNFMYTLTNA